MTLTANAANQQTKVVISNSEQFNVNIELEIDYIELEIRDAILNGEFACKVSIERNKGKYIEDYFKSLGYEIKRLGFIEWFTSNCFLTHRISWVEPKNICTGHNKTKFKCQEQK